MAEARERIVEAIVSWARRYRDRCYALAHHHGYEAGEVMRVEPLHELLQSLDALPPSAPAGDAPGCDHVVSATLRTDEVDDDATGVRAAERCEVMCAACVAVALAEELEACAKLIEDHGHSNGRILASHRHLATAIRGRLNLQPRPRDAEARARLEAEKIVADWIARHDYLDTSDPQVLGMLATLESDIAAALARDGRGA